MFGETGKLPMNSPQCHISFSVHSNTVVVGGWENVDLERGGCWRTLWPLTYTKQMRPGVDLLFWDFFR